MDDFWPGEHGEVGRIMQGSGDPAGEIDVACLLGRGQQASWLLGECKWKTQPQDGSVLHQLQQNAAKLLEKERVHQWLLFSRAGFTAPFRGQRPASTRLVDLAELYARP